GPVLCNTPEQGHREAGKTHLHEGRTSGRFCRASCLTYAGQGGHEEGWNGDGGGGYLARRHGLLLPDDPVTGSGRVRRDTDHASVPQLGPETRDCLYQPKCVRHRAGLWGPGVEMHTHTTVEPCHGEAEYRPL